MDNCRPGWDEYVLLADADPVRGLSTSGRFKVAAAREIQP